MQILKTIPFCIWIKQYSVLAAMAEVYAPPNFTYMSSLLPAGKQVIDTAVQTIVPASMRNNPMNPFAVAVGKAEAAYMVGSQLSRLIYESDAVIRPMLSIVGHNPIVFNTALTMVRWQYSRFRQGGNAKLANAKLPANIKQCTVLYDGGHDTVGMVLHEDFRNETVGPFAGKQVVFVVMRGTSSFMSAITDLNAGFANLSDLFGEQSGFGPKASMSGVNPFGAHRGFVNNMKGMYPMVFAEVSKVIEAVGKEPLQVVCVGHSLGGANATLAAMGLAGRRRAGLIPLNVDIHCITYGAPKLFTDYARNMFNELLLQRLLTLTRIANRSRLGADVIPLVPSWTDHPGFSILKTEMFTFSRTFRSKNISELRKLYGNIETRYTGILSRVNKAFISNPLPTYPAFYAQLKQSPSMDLASYTKLVNSLPFGTMYEAVMGKNPAYLETKALVQAVTGQAEVSTGAPPADTTPELDTAALAKAATNEDDEDSTVGPVQQAGGAWFKKSPAPAVAAPTPQPPQPQPQQGEPLWKQTQSSRDSTAAYKALTVTSQPSHIVYDGNTNISPLTKHGEYTGIAYNGVLKNFSASRSATRSAIIGGKRHSRQRRQRRAVPGAARQRKHTQHRKRRIARMLSRRAA